MNILVLGSGGFIGSHLTAALTLDGRYAVVAFDLVQEKLRELEGQAGLRLYVGDVREERALVTSLVEEADLVPDILDSPNDLGLQTSGLGK